MKKDIIYLKSNEFGDTLTAFDLNTLKRVEVYRQESCEIKKFDDIEDCEECLSRYLDKYNYKLTSRHDFNDALIGFSKMLNETTKEL